MRNIDKRFGIELASLRKFLLRQRGSAKPDRRLLEDRPTEYTDTCHWVDIAAMAADCLTQLMRDDYPQGIMDTSAWCVAQTQEAHDVKTRRGDQSRHRKAARREAEAAGGALTGTAP